MLRTRKPADPTFRRDILRLACAVVALFAAGALFLGTPALTLPSLVSIVLVTLFSPWVMALERNGFPRMTAIALLFVGLSAIGVCATVLAARSWQHEWIALQENGPSYFSSTVERISVLESSLRKSYPLLGRLKLAENISRYGVSFGEWFAAKAPGLVGDFLSCLFLVPILTFCLLSEGRNIKRRFFLLVPNRFFESAYSVTYGVSTALSDYIRAKLIEAFLVGILTTIGLAAVGSQYAIVLGIWAGVTNIIPYIGPILGAIPGILIAGLDAKGEASLIWGVVGVYAVANLIDTVLIFPGIVAKLVNLNPLILIASVVLGQYYYGIIGMLISIPIAAAIKVILKEFYVIIYGFSSELK